MHFPFMGQTSLRNITITGELRLTRIFRSQQTLCFAQKAGAIQACHARLSKHIAADHLPLVKGTCPCQVPV